jgi:hypothetical protein
MPRPFFRGEALGNGGRFVRSGAFFGHVGDGRQSDAAFGCTIDAIAATDGNNSRTSLFNRTLLQGTAMVTTSIEPPERLCVRLSRNLAYMITMSIMALMGSLFSTAAFAAGVHRVDVLAILFVMGASAALLMLIVWYLYQLRNR